MAHQPNDPEAPRNPLLPLRDDVGRLLSVVILSDPGETFLTRNSNCRSHFGPVNFKYKQFEQSLYQVSGVGSGQ